MFGIEFQHLGIAQFVKSIIRYLVNLFSSEIRDAIYIYIYIEFLGLIKIFMFWGSVVS